MELVVGFTASAVDEVEVQVETAGLLEVVSWLGGAA
jgi:hypothetical protein